MISHESVKEDGSETTNQTRHIYKATQLS